VIGAHPLQQRARLLTEMTLGAGVQRDDHAYYRSCGRSPVA
jgi:hypothetical protein